MKTREAGIRLHTLGPEHSVSVIQIFTASIHGDTNMNTQTLLNMALNGVDAIGYRLDQYGITGKINRHNIAAFLAVEQKHLEGEWDSIQVRVNRRRSQIERITHEIESRRDALVAPVLSRINRFRASQ